jgi:capsular polysaccharide biosynthesis protein
MQKIMTFQQQPEQSQHKNMQAEALALPPAWKPHGSAGVIWPIQSSPKIRCVEAYPTSDITTRLRNTWLGRVYTSHLKQHTFVRWNVQWIWRNGYPIYMNFLIICLFIKKKRWRPLTNLKEYAQKNGTPIYKLANEAFVETPEPKVFPACDQDYLMSPHDRYKFPEIYVATISNGMVYGGSNLVLVDGEAVCHDLYDFKRDYTSEELHGRTLIDAKSGRIRFLLHDEAPESIPVVATFVDACALNYAHWMTEVLPRIVLFCAEERFKDVPIVVNDGLHSNIMESLFLLVGADREIIALPIGRSLAVDELYLTSVAGYVPFEQRTNKLSGYSHGAFSPQAFDMLRNHLLGLEQNTKDQVWPENIFIRRNSGIRKCNNTAELEKLLIARDYVIVEPEKLTFLQQVQLFKNAKKIIASTGAALSNAIFCKPGTHIVILIAKHERMIYKYWVNMLASIQVKIFYVLGNIVKNNNMGIHGDFIVNASVIIDLLEALERK